jgi:hypothetical protein
LKAPPGKLTPKILKAVIEAGVPYANQLIAAAPKSIKKAQRDEITYFRHLKANHYSPKTPLAPYTSADARRLLDFQHKHCGIKGP